MNYTVLPGKTLFRLAGNTRSVANPPSAQPEIPYRPFEPGPLGTKEERQEWMRQKQLKKRRQSKGVAERG